nr:hypothetical protein [Candidatus Krumholzibacteria bacterium]
MISLRVFLLVLFVMSFGVAGCGEDSVPLRIEVGSFYVYSQSDLDQLVGTQQILGSLRIEKYPSMPVDDPVVDLSPLKDLIMVSGSLRIDNIDSLESLASLANLRSVGKDFFVGHNDNIRTLAPLQNLASVGNLYVQDNDRLKNLNGLQAIDFAPVKYLQIANNDSLMDLSGLENMTQLNGKSGLGIEISGNARLSSLNGLNNLSSTSALKLDQNPALADISPLRTLRNVQQLAINDCANITDFTAFADLDTCTELSLVDLPAPDLSAFASVVISKITLGRLPLDSLVGFGERESLDRLAIFEMPTLDDLEGLSALQRVEYLIIQENPLLESLNGLSSIESVRYVRFSHNEALCTSLVEEWLEEVVVDDEAVIYQNGDCKTKE